nr:PREDICTED: uncharacterized protein LOC105663124 [Megachile rotundata]
MTSLEDKFEAGSCRSASEVYLHSASFVLLSALYNILSFEGFLRTKIRVDIMAKHRRDLELPKKLTQIRECQSDIESDASDVELNEIENETENQPNSIEFSSSEVSTHKAADGTLWETLKDSRNTGRFPSHTKFKDVSGATSYAKRKVKLGCVKVLSI